MQRLDKLLITLLLVAIWFYRILPSIQGHLIYSNDAWDLTRDIMRSMENIFRPFICSPETSCYYNYWPSPVIISHILGSVAGLDIMIIPIIIVSASVILLSIASMTLVKNLLGKRIINAMILLLLIWPPNLHYTAFKAETIALPLEILVFAQLLNSLINERRTSLIALSLLAYGVVSTHHFTTYNMLWTSTLYVFLIYVLNGFRTVNKFLIKSIATISIISGLYFLVIREAKKPLNLEDLQILASYTVTLLLVATITNILSPEPPRKILDRLVLAASFASLIILNRVAHLLNAPQSESIGLLASGLSMAGLAITASRIINTRNNYGSAGERLFVAWIIPPLSLSIYALFDNYAFLIYRGFVALSIPLIIAAAPALSKEYLRRDRVLIIALLMILVSAIIVSPMIVLNKRDPYTGSLWIYSSGEVSDLEKISFLINNTICTDTRIGPVLRFFIDNEVRDCSINIARGSLPRNTSVIISMAIYPYVLLPSARLEYVEWNKLQGKDLVYNSDLVRVFMS